MEKTYLETTIFSFYYDDRPQSEIVARRNWSRQLIDELRTEYFMVTSPAVLTELSRGNKPHKDKAHGLALSFPEVEINGQIKEMVAIYLKHLLMPRDPLGDALHLALASFHQCDYLVTWNCAHLANAHKFGHIKRVNDLLHMRTPTILTPLEILGEKP